MKNIVISAKRQKQELWWFLSAFIIANICNGWAIYQYNAPVSEMLTSFFYVLIFTFVLYVVSVLIRLLIYFITKLFSKKQTAS